MSYKYHEIQGGRKFGELPELEQSYIRKEWDRLCARKSCNTPEYIFLQKSNGRFFQATRGRIAANRYSGCAGGYWAIRYGDCTRWGFKKNPFGEYDAVPSEKCFAGLTLNTGETVNIPRTVHTKADALELAKKLGFEF